MSKAHNSSSMARERPWEDWPWICCRAWGVRTSWVELRRLYFGDPLHLCISDQRIIKAAPLGRHALGLSSPEASIVCDLWAATFSSFTLFRFGEFQEYCALLRDLPDAWTGIRVRLLCEAPPPKCLNIFCVSVGSASKPKFCCPNPDSTSCNFSLRNSQWIVT
jgi:hypothetical protein